MSRARSHPAVVAQLEHKRVSGAGDWRQLLVNALVGLLLLLLLSVFVEHGGSTGGLLAVVDDVDTVGGDEHRLDVLLEGGGGHVAMRGRRRVSDKAQRARAAYAHLVGAVRRAHLAALAHALAGLEAARPEQLAHAQRQRVVLECAAHAPFVVVRVVRVRRIVASVVDKGVVELHKAQATQALE